MFTPVQLCSVFGRLDTYRSRGQGASDSGNARELGGALPATHPYPGRDAIRQEVGEQLAKQILGEGA